MNSSLIQAYSPVPLITHPKHLNPGLLPWLQLVSQLSLAVLSVWVHYTPCSWSFQRCICVAAAHAQISIQPNTGGELIQISKLLCISSSSLVLGLAILATLASPSLCPYIIDSASLPGSPRITTCPCCDLEIVGRLRDLSGHFNHVPSTRDHSPGLPDAQCLRQLLRTFSPLSQKLTALKQNL